MIDLLHLDYGNWMLVFARASGFVTILPIFSMPNIPMRVRVALAALLAFLTLPGLPPFPLGHASFPGIVGLILREILSGVAIGFITRMVFYTVDLAGHFIANEMGLSLASILDPFSGEHTQAPGAALFYLAAVMLMTLDMHHWMLMGFVQTYTVLPMGGAQVREALLITIMDRTSRMFVVALQIAAPLIAVSFLIMLVFCILSRAVPQMNAFTESFAVRVLGGLLVFGLTLELMAQHILNLLRRLPEDMLRVGQGLGLG